MCCSALRDLIDIVFFRKYEFHMGSVRSGDQIRILSSGFLHADF
jgi:hypothetical protein